MSTGTGGGQEPPPPRYQRRDLWKVTAAKCRICRAPLHAVILEDTVEGGHLAIYFCATCDRN